MTDLTAMSVFLLLTCFYVIFISLPVEAYNYNQASPLNIGGTNGILSSPLFGKGFGDFLKSGLFQQKTPPESWIGRRALRDSSPRTPHSGDGVPENWTGRWLPDNPPATLPSISKPFLSPEPYPYHPTPSPFTGDGLDSSESQENPLLPRVSQNWTGRWFPDRPTTVAPSKAVRLQPSFSPSGSDSNLLNSVSHDLRNNSLMSREEETKSWTGRWLPPEQTTSQPAQQPIIQAEPLARVNSMWQMINSSCDDGKTNLTVDWDGNPVNYTCFNPHKYLEPDYDLPNLIIKSAIPKEYKARHECMSRTIEYPTDLPTFGTHRPAWPRYGEYKFLPRQRWLHSLEHGAVVMLYHPCAHPALVNELKEMVTSCLYRHIITPYTLLPPDRPMALLTWGWALLLTSPDKQGVFNFIRRHALHGPETTSKDGQFSEGLIQPAKVITDQDDTTDIGLCPQRLF